MNKYVIAAIMVVLGLAAAGFYFLSSGPVNEQAAGHGHGGVDTAEDSTAGESGSQDLPEYIAGANVGEVVDATGQSEFTISIDDYLYEETVVTVSKGTTVTWTNNGAIGHDVTSDDASPQQGLSSPMLASGETYSYTFDETGTYNYYCQPHPFQMKAVIEVVE